MRQPLVNILRDNKSKVLVLDGGQGTELENRGLNISSPIWSTVPFLTEGFWNSGSDCQERDIIKEMFEAYLKSGAHIFTTLTYQTSFRTIVENTIVSNVEEYDQLLNKIVKFCRECVPSHTYLLGSIGTYAAYVGAEYHGDYGPDTSEIDFAEYFRPQLTNFNQNSNIDMIAFETVPNKYELKALLSWDESVIAKPFFISLSMNNDSTLRDGTTMAEVGKLVRDRTVKNSNLILIGINCCSYEASLHILTQLHAEIPETPLLVYCNGGGTYEHATQMWHVTPAADLPQWSELVPGYIANGARIIGGCCRTTPSDIKAISDVVTSSEHSSYA